MRSVTTRLLCVAAGLSLAAGSNAEPIGAAFTYQGQLKQYGLPVTGLADFEFHLWDAETGGTELATIFLGGESLGNGLFTVQLAFDASFFDGSPRYLEVHVAVPSGGTLTLLTGRQPITPAPYALYALDVPGGGDSWALAGNAGTTPGTNFLGTTDDQSLELHVGGDRALRIEPDDNSPNLIGGHEDNAVTANVAGATISGGGTGGMTHRVTDEGGSIGGGMNNQAGDGAGTTINASDATVAGGYSNTASGLRSTIGGGRDNTASGINSTVGGGDNNTALGSDSAVSGGANNSASAIHSTVAGGSTNAASGSKSTVGGGEHNTANGLLTTIPGGSYNEASGTNSLAAGQRAQALDVGTFVWSDSTTTDPDFFYSTGPNQFLINATGGVGINTNSPGAALHIGGTPGTDGIMFPDGTLQVTAATAGSGGLWTPSGNNIYYNAGNVGIGSTSMAYPLDVRSSETTTLHARNTSNGAAIDAISINGVAIYATASGSTGATKGISAEAHSPNGYAIHGTNEAESGNAFGVYGESSSPTGFGGYFEGRGYFSGNVGIGTSDPSGPLHVEGNSSSTIYGLNTAASGAGLGGRFESTSTEGVAARGLALATEGTTFGVAGQSNSTSGIGVMGWAAASSGNTRGIWGQSQSPDGHAGYFEGRGYFSDKVGIGTSTPQSRLHLVGPDDALDGPLFTLEADTAESFESGRIRFGESTGDMRGAFIHYDGFQNTLNLGTHQAHDSDPANDINAITIKRASGNVGINREAVAWPLHVGGDAYFEERVGIGASSSEAELRVGGDTQLDGFVTIGKDVDPYGAKLEIEAVNNEGIYVSTGDDGIFAETLSTTGVKRGIQGEAIMSPDGIGVLGTGQGVGVKGVVYGLSGEGRGIYGYASGSDQHAGYFDGRGYFSSRLGIYTPDPTARLHIGGEPGIDGIRFPDDSLLTTAYPTWQRSGDKTYYTAGNVGIGITSPTSKLHVVGAVSLDDAVIYGETNSVNEDAAGVRGWATNLIGDAIGVKGQAMGEGGIGVLAEGHGIRGYGVKASGYYGVAGECKDGFAGIRARSYGSTLYALHVDSLADNTFAAGFSGDVHVAGNLSKVGGDFKIDHPLDPENKYLHHSFVESPDMMNVYNGNIVTDEHGYATVEMPEWFGALNRDFRYQLTLIDSEDTDTWVFAKVVREIKDNRFTIRTSQPHAKVSWQVTGIRQDAWANAHRIQVEEDKPEDERGYYICPEVYGKTIEQSITWQKLPPREQREIREKLRLSRAEEAQEAEGGTQ